jgi:hypothetical protein
MVPSADILGYQYGFTDPLIEFGSADILPILDYETSQACPSSSSSFSNDPYPSILDSWLPNVIPSFPQNTTSTFLDCDLSSVFQLESIMDKVMPLDWETCVPGFNFQLGDEIGIGFGDVLQVTDDLGLAAWAGYE